MAERNYERACEVCDAPIDRSTRCTNGRCIKCHAAWCSPGGVTYEGHFRRWPEGHAHPSAVAQREARARLEAGR